MTTGASPAADDPDRRGRLRRIVARVEDAVLVLLLAAMILLAGLQILLRNVWDAGLVWGDPALRLLVLWTGLLGAMVATREDNHITVDALSRFLPPKAKLAGRALTDLFAAVVCGTLAWHGARLVLIDRELGTQAFGTMPAWIGEIIIPVGFGVMAVRFLLNSCTRFRPGR